MLSRRGVMRKGSFFSAASATVSPYPDNAVQSYHSLVVTSGSPAAVTVCKQFSGLMRALSIRLQIRAWIYPAKRG